MTIRMTEPMIEQRPKQHYAGIRTRVRASKFSTKFPAFADEIFRWLDGRGIEPAGPLFMRYHIINMGNLMDVEVGVPVAAPIQGNGRIEPGIIPAGRYAALTYTGVKHGIAGNAALLD